MKHLCKWEKQQGRRQDFEMNKRSYGTRNTFTRGEKCRVLEVVLTSLGPIIIIYQKNVILVVYRLQNLHVQLVRFQVITVFLKVFKDAFCLIFRGTKSQILGPKKVIFFSSIKYGFYLGSAIKQIDNVNCSPRGINNKILPRIFVAMSFEYFKNNSVARMSKL